MDIAIYETLEIYIRISDQDTIMAVFDTIDIYSVNFHFLQSFM